MCQPRNTLWYSTLHLLAVGVAGGGLALSSASCTAPSSSGLSVQTDREGVARLLFGASPAEARAGHSGSFVLESTPDLAVHATLSGATYEGKTLQIRGVDPQGLVVWSYPHLQKGESFDAVLPVFGSVAARKHVTGAYSFSLVAPDRTVVAEGKATFTSSRDAARDAGGAPHALRSSSSGERVAAAGEE